MTAACHHGIFIAGSHPVCAYHCCKGRVRKGLGMIRVSGSQGFGRSRLKERLFEDWLPVYPYACSSTPHWADASLDAHAQHKDLSPFIHDRCLLMLDTSVHIGVSTAAGIAIIERKKCIPTDAGVVRPRIPLGMSDGNSCFLTSSKVLTNKPPQLQWNGIRNALSGRPNHHGQAGSLDSSQWDSGPDLAAKLFVHNATASGKGLMWLRPYSKEGLRLGYPDTSWRGYTHQHQHFRRGFVIDVFPLGSLPKLYSISPQSPGPFLWDFSSDLSFFFLWLLTFYSQTLIGYQAEARVVCPRKFRADKLWLAATFPFGTGMKGFGRGIGGEEARIGPRCPLERRPPVVGLSAALQVELAGGKEHRYD